MDYIATRSLSIKGGLIRKGQSVPLSYPRFKEGIRRGWIKQVNETVNLVKPDETVKSKPDKVVEIIEEVPKPVLEINTETELPLEPESNEFADNFADAAIDAALRAKPISEMRCISVNRVKVLESNGYLSFSDLKDVTVETIEGINGIGFITASRILKEYNEFITELKEFNRK